MVGGLNEGSSLEAIKAYNEASNLVQECGTIWDLEKDIQVCAGEERGLVWLNLLMCNQCL